MPERRLLSVVVATLMLLAACGDNGDAATGTTTSAAAGAPLDGTITVLAAASLTNAFAEIADAFEAEHDGVEVHLSFDGSAKLATAIIEGAPADLFASADDANMAKVAGEDLLAGEPSTFATNELQIVVPASNPLGIDALDDLTGPDIVLSLCGEAVPCGRYAAQAFAAAGLGVPPAGDQDNVKGVLTQVQLGEADAGIVYVTDVLAADGVDGVDLAEAQRVEAAYPAAVLTEAPNPEVAAAFLAFLTGEPAQEILADYGFGSA